MKRIIFIDIYKGNMLNTPYAQFDEHNYLSGNIDFSDVNGFRIVTTDDDNIDINKLKSKLKLIDNDEYVFEKFNCEQEIYYSVPVYKYSELPENIKRQLVKFYNNYAKLCSYFVLKNNEGKIIDVAAKTDYMYKLNSKEELKDVFYTKLSEQNDYLINNKKN